MCKNRQTRLLRRWTWRAAAVAMAGGMAASALCAALGEGEPQRFPLRGQKEERKPLFRVNLPPPRKKGLMSVEEALARRRSIRSFRRQPLTLAQIGQLMWAGQGITDRVKGLRTAPSAGALYPIEIYLVAPDGAYHYDPRDHCLERLGRADLRSRLAERAVNQSCVSEAALDVVITAVVRRTEEKYGERARRYALLEAGHVAQNILLQTTALKLGGVCVGAFYDERVKELLGLPDDHEPFYILSIGLPR